MCGRYQFDSEINIAELQKIIQQLNRDYSGTQKLAAMKTGEIFPTDVAPVITFEGAEEKPALMNWGFPKWDSSGVLINARSETAESKPLFKSAFLERRCLIPSTGFFEWQHKEGPSNKKKYLLRLPDTPMLYMAGLYGFFKDTGDLMTPSFVILTTEANPFVSPIHDRMPLVLSSADRRLWLSDTSYAHSLLHKPCEEKLLLYGPDEKQLELF